MDRIETFISKFKANDMNTKPSSAEKIFKNGNCYHFAAILDNLFPGEIVYHEVDGHFLFHSKGKYYDITGPVKIDNKKHISVFKGKTPTIKRTIDPLLRQRLIRQTIRLTE